MPGIEVHLRSTTDSPAEARDALRGLSRELPQPLVEDIRLLVSELVTNSVRHAGLGPEATIRLRADILPDRVRVEVTDPGPGFEPGQESPNIYQDSGWGLYLVGQVATRWGVELDEATKVWFEIDRETAIAG
ncbi:MAG: ATP-binding protein [Actinomycetota bacterium]|nr:ATP-binding protein [Actinomycetota bacterium]